MRQKEATYTAQPAMSPDKVKEKLAYAVRKCGENMCRNAEMIVGDYPWRVEGEFEIIISINKDFVPTIRVEQEYYPF